MLRCSDFKPNIAALTEIGAAVLLVHHEMRADASDNVSALHLKRCFSYKFGIAFGDLSETMLAAPPAGAGASAIQLAYGIGSRMRS